MEQHLAQFKEVISTLMSGDNALRGQAEEAYNTAKKTNPDVLCQCLVHLLRNDQDEQASRLRDPRISCPPAPFALRCTRSEPARQRRTVDHHTAHSKAAARSGCVCAHLLCQVRSMCGLLLRKLASELKLGVDQQQPPSPGIDQLVRTELLASIPAEPQRHIRKKICDAVGMYGVYKLTSNLQSWPELFTFIMEATRAADPNLHEAGLIIFNALSELIAESMTMYHPTLLQVFRDSLQPGKAMVVRNAALKALASFLLSLKDVASRNAFQELVPLMMSTIAQALQAGEEDETRSAIEVFVEIAEASPKFLKTHVTDCVNGMLQIAPNHDLEEATRHLALEFLLTVAENMTGVAKKIGLCEHTVPVALAMMLELECDTAEELAEWENENEENESSEITSYDFGEEALDRLAIALGGKIMVRRSCEGELRPITATERGRADAVGSGANCACHLAVGHRGVQATPIASAALSSHPPPDAPPSHIPRCRCSSPKSRSSSSRRIGSSDMPRSWPSRSLARAVRSRCASSSRRSSQ